jgi:cytochrome b561
MSAAAPLRYDSLTIRLHWTFVVLVALQWLGAQFIDFIPGRPAHQLYWSIHITIGALLTLVVATQLWWRATGGARLPPSNEEGWQRATRTMHVTLNTLLTAVVLLGIGIVLARGWTLYWTFTIPMVPGGSRHLAGQIHGVHEWLADVLVFLATGHALAALFHYFRLHDGVLARMVPWAAGRSQKSRV